ncbi:MAG: 6-carboxytetrahydropterin synthase [Pseudomonadota bacterium]
MKLELVVTLALNASHCLEERERPHPHRWDIQIGLEGDLNNGRVVSLTAAQELFGSTIAPLQNTFLNDNKVLDEGTRAQPTCENLALFLLSEIQPKLTLLGNGNPPQLSFIQVGIWDEGVQLGFAKLSV